jgi:hypothetical protein
MINKLNNKLVIGLAIGLIVIATLMPRYFTHRRVIGKVLDTQILEKIEQVPVKRVTINSDNVSSVKDTNKNFKRYRLQIRYQYFAKGKRHVGLHKFGDYPGYLTELELINVKSKYYKGGNIPVYVNKFVSSQSQLRAPVNYPRVCLSTVGIVILYYHIIKVLLNMKENLKLKQK